MRKEEIILNEIVSNELRVTGITQEYPYGFGGAAVPTVSTSSKKVVSPEKLAKFLAKFVNIPAEDLIDDIKECDHVTGNSGKCIKCNK